MAMILVLVLSPRASGDGIAVSSLPSYSPVYSSYTVGLTLMAVMMGLTLLGTCSVVAANTVAVVTHARGVE